MPRPHLVLVVLVVLSGSTAFAANRPARPVGAVESAAAADPDTAADPQWVFSALPRAFDPHPPVDYNIITEMTPAGRKAAHPTAQKPAYFELTAGGHLRLGIGATFNDQGPPIAEMQRILTDALASTHHLPAELSTHPPSLLIIFHWGAHSAGTDGDDDAAQNASLDTAGDTAGAADAAAATSSTGNRRATPREIADFLERARLVGGDKFAEELLAALSARSASNDSLGVQQSQRPVPAGMTAIPNIMGDLGGLFAFDPTNPIDAFKRRQKHNESLLEDARGSIYFVLASAYDYASVARGERVLLWRTKMTINSDGLAMSETLLPLITNAAPYFGREMRTASVITKRLDREGSVEVGTPTVVEVMDETVPAPPPAAATEAEAPAPTTVPQP